MDKKERCFQLVGVQQHLWNTSSLRNIHVKHVLFLLHNNNPDDMPEKNKHVRFVLHWFSETAFLFVFVGNKFPKMCWKPLG